MHLPMRNSVICSYHEKNGSIFRYVTDLSYIRFLTDTSDPLYKNAVHIDSIEEPQIKLLRKECDDLLLDSPYIEGIRAEFGDKIIQDMRTRKTSPGAGCSKATSDNTSDLQYVYSP
ncbi:hypothetical protein EBB07_30215 [Paenibacillaceae bacterium]|nr:hypothetical protein EBB07_30215 [Paenibacillaceae bacterium]